MPHARILVVEEQELLSSEIQAGLQKVGYRFSMARTGEAALRKARLERPDLVLTDTKLPGKLDGIATAKRIHEELGIPVIYITASADPDTVDRAKRTNPAGYLVKPIRERDLAILLEITLYKESVTPEAPMDDEAGILSVLDRLRQRRDALDEAIPAFERLAAGRPVKKRTRGPGSRKTSTRRGPYGI